MKHSFIYIYNQAVRPAYLAAQRKGRGREGRRGEGRGGDGRGWEGVGLKGGGGGEGNEIIG